MQTINVNASKSYEVRIGRKILDHAGGLIRTAVGGQRICLVTDDTVEKLYADRVTKSLEQADYTVVRFVIKHGEESKCAENYLKLQSFMAQQHLTRADVVVALGGGVVGDLSGFAAATFLRGVAFVQMPTTCLAAVDSSVGGKTAIDLPEGKNLVGAFYQPSIVLCDIETFATLPEEILCDGFAEVIKYGMLGNKDLLTKLLTAKKEDVEEIVAICVGMKRDIVREDEFDHGKRQLLNFGHTVGHAVEACSGYRISHGSAVAIGMAVITRAAVAAGMCGIEVYDILKKLLDRYHLPDRTEFSIDELYEVMTSDKKREGATINIVCPTEIGKCILRPVAMNDVKTVVSLGK